MKWYSLKATFLVLLRQRRRLHCPTNTHARTTLSIYLPLGTLEVPSHAVVSWPPPCSTYDSAACVTMLKSMATTDLPSLPGSLMSDKKE